MFNHGVDPFTIKQGDRIAQLIIHKITLALPKETTTLDDTIRGERGFGSSDRVEKVSALIEEADENGEIVEENSNNNTLTTENKGKLIQVDRKDRQTVEQLISEAHDPITAGHPCPEATVKSIQQRYTWHGITKDVTKYTKGCIHCQQTKIDHSKKHAPLHPIPPPSRPFQTISMDLIAPLPDSSGYDAILVIIDYLTKLKVLCKTTTHVTAAGIALLIQIFVFSRYGRIESVITDRGPQFVSNFMREFYKMLKITGKPSTAYHPQTDGQTK
jgi:hypothetical protein